MPSTRSDWERAFELLMAPVVANVSPGGARIYLPGGRPSGNGREIDSLEAFARSLWMAGPWLASHPDGSTTAALRSVNLTDFYTRGILAGTDPFHPESWYALLRTRQTLVEAAAVAWNLWVAKRALWDPLSSRERGRVLAWLQEAAAISSPESNWLLFTVLVHTVLKLLGGRYDQAVVDRSVDLVESFYVGDGWYGDGDPRNHPSPRLDYYNAWVMHPYLLLWCHADDDGSSERKDRIVQRAQLFQRGFVHWFAEDGRFPCFGRSTLYRMAVTHVFVASVLTETCPLPPGQVRRLCSLVLQRFLHEPGAVDDAGQLTMGFAREYIPMVEPYSGPGSPYWAGKAFGVLALPSEHPFWTSPEIPLPIEQDDFLLMLPSAGFLLRGTKATGHVQVVNGSSVYLPKKYSDLAYSSHFGYEAQGGDSPADPDRVGEAGLTLSRDGRTWFGRRAARCLGIVDGVLLTEALHPLGRSPLAPRARVITAAAFVGDQLLRVHRIETRLRVFTLEGGFAFGWREGPATLEGGKVSFARAGGAGSGIRGLLGYDDHVQPIRSDRNVLEPFSAVPHARTASRRSGVFHVASASLARPRAFDPDGVGRGLEDSVDRLLPLVENAAASRPPWSSQLLVRRAVRRFRSFGERRRGNRRGT